jgi:hypothetical protein
MTLVEIRYRFIAPFEDQFTAAIEAAHSIYGLRAVKLDANLEGVTVLYDASRLSPEDVENALRRLGLPVVRRED